MSGRRYWAKRLFAGLLAVAAFATASIFWLQAPSPALGQNREVKIGVLAKRGHSMALQKWGPTADYLNREIPNYKFSIIPYNFRGIREAVDRAEIDFVITNSGYYVELEETYGVSRIATLMNLLHHKGYDKFGGVIFTRSGRNDLEQLSDLTGKKFMAVNKDSLGGWWMAWREFNDLVLDPWSDFSALRFGGTHDAVVTAVLSGQVDAGTVRTDTLERMAQEGKIKLADFKILNPQPKNQSFPFLRSTRLYPEWPWAKLKHTHDELARSVSVALLSMPASGPAAKAARITGWTVPMNYQPVHQLMRELKLGPYKDLGKVTMGLILNMYWHWIIAVGVAILALSLVTVHVVNLNRVLRLARADLHEQLDMRQKAENELQKAHDELEQRVHERTAELEEANLKLHDEIADRVHAEENARESRAQLEQILKTIPSGIMLLDADSHEIIRVNQATCDMLKRPQEDVVGRVCHNFVCVYDKGACPVTDLNEEMDHSERVLLAADGQEIPILKNATTFLLKGRWLIIESFIDISKSKQMEAERKRLEAQLTQAQKMEAIGTLAGGIAHDFNNILGAIMGYGELALHQARLGQPNEAEIENFLSAARRATELVKQILSFSRQADIERAPVELKSIIREALKLLRASLPSTIDIKQKIEPNLDPVLADPTQIHQVILNLCTNASHAMSLGGGTLSIELKRTFLDEEEARRYAELSEGYYQRVSVSDTGCGMDRNTQERVFEPFFTTKDKSKGTGMGLSVVHGIVKSHGGAITLYSEPGKGSTFRVYLPCPEHEARDAVPAEVVPVPTGSEHILLVDDESPLVESGAKLLEILGYRVTGMTSSLDALRLFRETPRDFDLLLTDLTMPHMTGDELAQEVLSIRKDMPIIICTGFSEQFSQKNAGELGIKDYLIKPLTLRKAGLAVRKALDQ